MRKKFPKLRGVIMVNDVRKLVCYDIIDHFRGCKKQLQRKSERPIKAAAPKAVSILAHAKAFRRDSHRCFITRNRACEVVCEARFKFALCMRAGIITLPLPKNRQLSCVRIQRIFQFSLLFLQLLHLFIDPFKILIYKGERMGFADTKREIDTQHDAAI